VIHLNSLLDAKVKSNHMLFSELMRFGFVTLVLDDKHHRHTNEDDRTPCTHTGTSTQMLGGQFIQGNPNFSTCRGTKNINKKNNTKTYII
jgi:hypothetical protein